MEPAEYGPANCPPCQMWHEVNRLMTDFFYDKRPYGKRVCGKKFCVKKAGAGAPPNEPGPR